jgi:hypothetical protein
MGVKLGRSFTLRKERRVKFFENRALSGIFGPKRDEVREESRLLHNVELYDLYCLPIIICGIRDQIEKNKMGVSCGTYGTRGEVHAGFWWGNLRERDHLKTPDVDGRIILSCIFRKWIREPELDRASSG